MDKRQRRMLNNVPDREAMEFYKSRYFYINMRMLKFMGLWPYQNKVTKIVIRILFSILIIISMVPQVIGAIVLRKLLPRLIQSIGTLFYMFGIASKFFGMLLTEKKLTMMYQVMVKNWKMLENQAEREILMKHSEIGRLLTIGYLTYMFGAMVLFISLPVAPRLVNMVTPIFNGSLIEMTILDGEYIVDKEEYYYYIYLFETCTCVMTVPLFSTIDSTYAVCVQQCVGLLAVVRLRLQSSTKQSKQLKSNNFKTKDVAYIAVLKAVELHQEVLNYGQILESSYSTSFLFVLAFNTSILTTTCVCVIFNLDDPVLLLRYGFLIMGFAIHMFYLSWPGQKLIDESNAIFYAAYDNEWYECSVESQKLLKFIMRQTVTPLHLTSGGFYIMSFQNFEMLMKTALSYITVLASFK